MDENILVLAEPQLAQYVQRNRLSLPHDLSADEWDGVGGWLLAAQQVIDRNGVLVRMLRADWWRFGVDRYGEHRALQAQAIFGVSARTIKNDASELTNVSDECREVEGVTFEILAGVRHANPADQLPLVEQAVAEGWGRNEVEHRARPDGDTWQRTQLVRGMQNLYNRMDDAARAEFDKWYQEVQQLAQQRKATRKRK